ncbi:MAG: S1 RNA-binding domain-containing protein [Nanoarchaeota archaeon]|nr:S1 RNA-binding domain-containing protein [Nanoarchaeota archaeon]
MLYRREGFPQDDELVFCTVTKIMHSSVFVVLDEYERSGMINISEIAPGRIRNIRDYVTQGKKVVCKVLRVDKVKGHIDVSLRRVNDMERKRKLEEIKQEQKAEKIIELIAKELKIKTEELYEKVANQAFEKYPYLFSFFKDVGEEKAHVKDLGLGKKETDLLQTIVADKFKPPKIEIKGFFDLKTYQPNGVDIIKKILVGVEKTAGVSLDYLGGGRYRIKVESDSYKNAEKTLAEIETQVLSDIKKNKGEGSFKRE